MFGAIAPSYDLNNRIHSFWQDQRWRRRGVRLADPGSDAMVVDVACGTGDLAEAFLKAGASQVIGIDFTPEMLDVARERAARAGLKRIEYRQGDATQLELPTDSADVLSIAFGIRNVNEPARALSEFRRILKPGGRLLILEFSQPTNPIIRVINDLYTRRIMPWTATMLSGDRSGAYRYLPRSIETFLPRAELEQSIRDAGFETIRQIPMTFGVCVAYVAS
ncbi:MAG: bifunctional demethylmenaquinone methyltransferase/2-methoxy-6-polyprenyl-1,4-benzoquinol methylase UbiE [Phycisphaerales bacterium]|nr:bifunctional demethylmenaquinone methyltransferase/2-methoxy-6-polyprenyl-1,4-benzoquinol methylase UbiE [Phycisphaerales bacterium]